MTDGLGARWDVDGEQIAAEVMAGEKFYSEDQPRDESGKWTLAAGGGGTFEQRDEGYGMGETHELVDGPEKMSVSRHAEELLKNAKATIAALPGMNLELLREYAMRLETLQYLTNDDVKAKMQALVDRYGERTLGLAIADRNTYGQIADAGEYRANIDRALRATAHGVDQELTGAPDPSAEVPRDHLLGWAIREKLTPEEFLSYKNAARDYGTHDYRQMNSGWRDGNASPKAMLFDAALARTPDITEQTTFGRGMRLPVGDPLAEALKSGKGTYEIKQFWSGSVQKGFAEHWAKRSSGSGNPKERFVITWKNEGGAKNPSLLFGTTAEGEVIYRPGAKMQIVGAKLEKGKDGYPDVWHIKAKVKP